MTDFSQLNIANADQLFSALKNEVVGTSTQWFNANASAVSGYLQTLAQAAIETQNSLLQKRIPEAQAQMIMANQKAAFEQTIQFTEYMTLALAQSLLDSVFSIIGWTIFKQTGVNLFPDLVQPGAGG